MPPGNDGKRTHLCSKKATWDIRRDNVVLKRTFQRVSGKKSVLGGPLLLSLFIHELEAWEHVLILRACSLKILKFTEVGHARTPWISLSYLGNFRSPFLPRTPLVAYQNGIRVDMCGLKKVTSDSDTVLLPP